MSVYISETVSNSPIYIEKDEVQEALNFYEAFEAQDDPAACKSWLKTIDSKLRTSLWLEITRRKKEIKNQSKTKASSYTCGVVEREDQSSSYRSDDIGIARPVTINPTIKPFFGEDHPSTIETRNVGSESSGVSSSTVSQSNLATKNPSTTTLPYRMGFTTPDLHRFYLAIRREARRECSNIDFTRYWSDQDTNAKNLDVDRLKQLWSREGSYGWERSLIIELLQNMCRTGAQNTARKQYKAERGIGITDGSAVKLKPGRKKKSIKQALSVCDRDKKHALEIEQVNMLPPIKRRTMEPSERVSFQLIKEIKSP